MNIDMHTHFIAPERIDASRKNGLAYGCKIDQDRAGRLQILVTGRRQTAGVITGSLRCSAALCFSWKHHSPANFKRLSTLRDREVNS